MWVLTRFVVYWCCVDHGISFSKCETINFSLIHVFFPLLSSSNPWTMKALRAERRKKRRLNPGTDNRVSNQISLLCDSHKLCFNPRNAICDDLSIAWNILSHNFPLKISFTMCGLINIHDFTCAYAKCGALMTKKRIKAVLKWREMRFPEGNCGIQECPVVLSLECIPAVCQRTRLGGTTMSFHVPKRGIARQNYFQVDITPPHRPTLADISRRLFSQRA